MASQSIKDHFAKTRKQTKRKQNGDDEDAAGTSSSSGAKKGMPVFSLHSISMTLDWMKGRGVRLQTKRA